MGWLRRVAVVALAGAAGCGGSEAQPVAKTPSADCRQLLALGGSVQAALQGQAAAPQEFDALVANGPAAIRPDIATIADAYGRLAPALQGLPDPQAVERLEKTVKALDQDALVAANERVTAWVTANC